MDNTPFAGLERLEIGDPIGPGFLFRNPTIIDILLRIGAISHRHDAHARLADPVGAPTVTPSNVGGSIPSDTPVYVGWTWVDADGGETLLSDVTQVSTDPGLPDPTTAPDVAVDNVAGTLLAGTYYYAVTVTDGLGGESLIGPTIEAVVDPGFANAEIVVSGLDTIMADSGATGWRLWRAVGAGTWHMMVAGAGASVTDDGSLHGDCDITPPTTPQTNRTNKLTVNVPGPAPADAVSFNLYLSEDGSFGSPSFVANHLVVDVATDIEILDLFVSTGSPPPVATTFPGANMIDPDTELVDWHWKRPVATVGDLPAVGNAAGDVRAVSADGSIYAWTGAAWAKLPGHIIVKPDDTAMAARSKLKFAGTAITSITDDAGGDRTIVTIDGGGGGSTPVYPFTTHIEWTDLATGTTTVVALRPEERIEARPRDEEPFTGAAGSVGDGYARDGSGNGIPEAGSNNTNAIHYIGGLTQDDGYVERTFTVATANWTRIGVTLGHGRKGLFAYITRADGVVHLAWRDVDTGSDADFHDIATDTLPALPGAGDTYNIQLEKVGNDLNVTVFQSMAVVAECSGTVPVAMQAEYGDDQFLFPGLSDRWSNPDAWTTDFIQSFWYVYHRELWADATGSVTSASRKLLDDWGAPANSMSAMTAPDGFDADWSDGIHIVGYQRDFDGRVYLAGRAVKTGGAAPADGDVIGQLEPAARPSDPAFCAVATGDDTTYATGIVEINPSGEIIWHDGYSVAIATHPFVCLDGINYPGVGLG
jgi:hypothetical protein